MSDVGSSQFEGSHPLVIAKGLELNGNGFWHHLLTSPYMGIFDWKEHNAHLSQVTPLMWHSTAITTRLVLRILELESKVVDTSSGSVRELTEVSLA